MYQNDINNSNFVKNIKLRIFKVKRLN